MKDRKLIARFLDESTDEELLDFVINAAWKHEAIRDCIRALLKFMVVRGR